MQGDAAAMSGGGRLMLESRLIDRAREVERRLIDWARDIVLISRDRGVRTLVLGIVVAFVFFKIYNVFWVGPNNELTSESDGLSKIEFYQVKNSIRQTFAQVLGGTVLLLGLYFTAKTLQTAQEGQITDRFTRAINQLGEQGPEKLAIRLGGIYALERIAEDSARDKQAIAKILTTYVRVHAPWKEESCSPDDLPPSKTHPAPNSQSSPKLAIDIQAILTILGRYPWTTVYEGFNLSKTDLRGAFLWKAQLERAYLWGAHLERANLKKANLKRATLWDTHLEEADLQGAHLDKANLGRANLRGAKNLTVEQLSTVESLYEADLDAPLREQIEQRYPYLLEEPQD
jgi:hypothetical protein